MNGGQGAGQIQGRTQLRQGHVGTFAEQLFHLAAMLIQNLSFSPGKPVAWPNIPSPATLLQQLLHHTQ